MPTDPRLGPLLDALRRLPSSRGRAQEPEPIYARPDGQPYKVAGVSNVAQPSIGPTGPRGLLQAAAQALPDGRLSRGLLSVQRSLETKPGANPISFGAKLMGLDNPLSMVEGPARAMAPFAGRVYHGTDALFDAFDPAKIGSRTDSGNLGRGFYFSTDPNVAASYTHSREVDVALDNPLEFKQTSPLLSKQILVREALGLPRTATSDEVTAAAMARGHDGVVLDYSPWGYNHQEIVAFRPEQAKIRRQ